MSQLTGIWGDGFFPVPRSTFPKSGYEGPDRDQPARMREAEIDLWALANHDDRNGLSRGQCRASLSFLAKRWNWDRSKVQRFLNRLKREGKIRRYRPPGRKPTVIELIDYQPDPKPIQPTRSEGGSARQTPPVDSRGRRRRGTPGSDTPPEPNGTKKASPTKVDGYVERPCPSCRGTILAEGHSLCSRCRDLDQKRMHAAEWTPEPEPEGGDEYVLG